MVSSSEIGSVKGKLVRINEIIMGVLLTSIKIPVFYINNY